MAKKNKISVILTLILIFVVTFSLLTACSDDNSVRDKNTILRFSAPEGTPALAMLRLVEDNKTIDGTQMEYDVVNPSNIAVEMSDKKSDIVIMPVNAGANLIRQGAEYKLISIAVKGSLFMVGTTANGGTISINDIKGKKIACIGQTGVPGLIFRYVMQKNNISVLTDNTSKPDASKNEIFVQYVADGNAARTLLADNQVDFAVVGEPAATAFKASLGCNAEMDMQKAYADCTGNTDNYPQAGLFVKNELSKDKAFIDALFVALKNSKNWITANPASVTEFAKTKLYESAVFPAASIPRCAIDAEKITEDGKNEVITFLSAVAGKDSQGNTVNWADLKNQLFA